MLPLASTTSIAFKLVSILEFPLDFEPEELLLLLEGAGREELLLLLLLLVEGLL